MSQNCNYQIEGKYPSTRTNKGVLAALAKLPPKLYSTVKVKVTLSGECRLEMAFAVGFIRWIINPGTKIVLQGRVGDDHSSGGVWRASVVLLKAFSERDDFAKTLLQRAKRFAEAADLLESEIEK